MIVIPMGVSGSGKTTVGRLLATDLGWPFHDADDFHPPENVAKMRAGVPLADADRAVWLDRLRSLIEELIAARRSAVLACSALKQAYRDRLAVDPAAVRFVYLRGDYELIRRRLQERTGHYMPAALLRSQFETLEEPGTDVLVVDVAPAPAEIVATIQHALGLDAR